MPETSEKDAKPKQGRLPGMTPTHIAEIEDAGQQLLELRTQRMELGEQEEKAQVKLLDLMKKHKVRQSPVGDTHVATIEPGEERAYVRRSKKAGKAKKEKKGDASD